MRTKQLDHDEIYCPITKRVMRHPVLASDGYHYELKWLFKYFKKVGNISPVTRQPITSVKDDTELDEILVNRTCPEKDRPKKYNKEPLLIEIQHYLPKPFSHLALRSGATALAVAFIFAVFCYLRNIHDPNEENNVNYLTTLCQIFALSAFLEVSLRYFNSNQLGFFGLSQQALQQVSHSINHDETVAADDPAIMIFAMP
ncbi:U-box domain-containing protein [Campylobacter concisus]|uniref:U-box domain-containing protein n=1 Tax=Campylobacter concisus TaxID=199 RepID=UPI0011E80ACB|nr:U-box domain-containing protein [Campylobacter concisus]